ncbi:uncharacterized protein EDB93DRAFT_278909 [Suillus bovinus]|uniref:uncharacterized protein n=1 Tax=Suillus bovinus TaxID=48563 RepID=UPI001B870F17|nr:uncharacterized protein EDB93DRAFT_278909 [Suillus bovinus]KAG2159297.1 hypothetical protein EDB93DRAFT_278909 [Suillus bovinus]
MSSSSNSVTCLLLAENLRCVPLNLVQMHALTIPPVIELFFCLFLIYMTRKSRRAHLLLAADGVLYFILALVDLLLHVLPAARNSIAISRVAELFLGSVSFLPILLYTSYLLWLSRMEFIPYLPHRFRPVAKYLFTGLIPVYVAFNFAVSLGMSIQNLSSPLIDFSNKSTLLWLNLGHMSLGLYTNYQCLISFLALYRLATALFDQWRIDINNTDERHFFNGTGWIVFGIKLGAFECLLGFLVGGFAGPLSRRILRLISRICIIVGTLKGMDENENFEILNKELLLWRRGKPLSTSHSLIANRRMTIQSLQFSDLSCPSSAIEKDVERGEVDQRATVHDEAGELAVSHTGRHFSALPLPERAIHADELRRQSGENTSAEVPTSRNDVIPSKRNTRRQSAQAIFDDAVVVLAPSVTGKYPGSMLSQGHEDDKSEPLALATCRNVAQSYGEKDVATECAVVRTSDSMEHKPKFPLTSIPQPAYTRAKGLMLPWTKLVSQHSDIYTVQFPARPTRARITSYPPTAHPEGESSDSLKRHHTQLSSLRSLELVSKYYSVATTHSSQWSTIARSQSTASIRMYGGVTAISSRRASADPDDLMFPLSAETLRDSRPQTVIDQKHITSADAFIHESQTALNREKTLRRLNGEVDV